MKMADIALYEQLRTSLDCYEKDNQILIGIIPEENRDALLFQMVESIRRIKYYNLIRDMDLTKKKPKYSDGFNPLKAAVHNFQLGNVDEAYWLVFLATHFGKNKDTGWKLVTDVYWALGTSQNWSWERVIHNPEHMYEWLRNNYKNLKQDGIPRKFGNHRKYETLKPTSNRSTWRVIQSYLTWIGGSHLDFLESLQIDAQDEKQLFQAAYNSMSCVVSFARTGKFDFLTTLSNLGIAPIVADSAYLKGATGPLRGTRLIVGGSTISNITANELEGFLSTLDSYLDVGMQVLEDSLCNWQKSPGEKIAFRG